jgi:glycosyltransferase involved in cell wall biosynthesis
MTTGSPFALSSLHVGMGWYEEQPGGLNRMVVNLLSHLPHAGVTAHALVAGSPEVASWSEGRVRSFAPLTAGLPQRAWRAAVALRAEVERWRPDVLALHFPLFALGGSRTRNRPAAVVHFHGPWAEEGRVEGDGPVTVLAKRQVEHLVYRPAERFIALSQAFARVLERDYRIDPALIRVVPGGVDLDRFRPEPSRQQARQALGLPTDRPIVLTVRRLARRMGLPDLIAGCSAARRHVPELLLAIAGGGPLRGELERQIEEVGLTDHVRLLGRVSDADLPLLYRAADLSVVPSTALEGFGLICVESLASGTPAMVTPVGGLPEVVSELDPALVLEETGPGAIADGIVTALRGGRPLPASAECVAYARERFAWPVIARRIGGVYEEAVR